MPITQNENIIFKDYKRGMRLAFQIEPITKLLKELNEQESKKEDPVPGVRPIKVSETPAELKIMFNRFERVLNHHGFELQVFGAPANMFKALSKDFRSQEVIEAEQKMDTLITNLKAGTISLEQTLKVCNEVKNLLKNNHGQEG